MHLPLSSRHHGSYGPLYPTDVPWARVGDGYVLFNDSTIVFLVLCLPVVLAVSDPFYSRASSLRGTTEYLIVEGVSELDLQGVLLS
jgi:hypothetical protein